MKNKEQKYYYVGRFFNDKKLFEEWVEEYNTSKVNPVSLSIALEWLSDHIKGNRHLIRKDLTNNELNSIIAQMFELFIKQVE